MLSSIQIIKKKFVELKDLMFPFLNNSSRVELLKYIGLCNEIERNIDYLLDV